MYALIPTFAASWSPFCHRVLLTLEEKHIPYSLRYVKKGEFPDWFSNLFPKFVDVLKATSKDKASSKEALQSELSAVGEKLEDNKFYKGDLFGAADAALAPKLHHIIIMMAKAEGWNVCADYPAIKAYMTRVRSRPSWQACLYSDMIVEAEWTKALNL
ncbi:hypothetical protein H632_c724p0 [Helicosporidium sp. ATCC 50920]|nr:hypothetical protein H632_c724p0 [Helicosporidium sp. ATCC 50920]|eukprot:KDD75359.1 hypothetical protein H632_c724p0 [Helicosporidium sp. ATCC 50920]